MYIKSIKIRNFKSIGGRTLNLDFSETAFWLMRGKSGNGKSTILNAITYALYGKNSNVKGQSKTTVPVSELINDINKKELLVELELSDDVIIRRGLKPDIFEIIKSGKNLADRSSKTIDQKYLEQEILGGMTYDMFTKVTSLSAKATTIPFFFMTPQQRKVFIEDILDIQILQYISDVIKQDLSTLKLDLRDVEYKLETQKSQLEFEKKSIEQQKLQRQKQLDQQDQIRSTLEEKKQSIQNVIVEDQEQLMSIVSKLSILKYERENIKIDHTLEQELSEKQASLTKVELQMQDIMNQLKIMKSKKDDFELRESKVKQQNPPCSNEQFSSCPVVSKVLGEFDYQEYNIKVDSLKGEGRELKLEHALISDNINTLKDKIQEQSTLQEKLNNIENEMFKLKEQGKTLQQRISDSKSQLEDIENQNYIVDVIEIDESRIDEIETIINTLQNQHDEIIEKQEQINRIKSRILDKSVKREIFEYYLPIFTQRSNEVLSKLFEEDSFDIKIELDQDFNIIGYKNGRKTNLYSLSQGQIGSLNFAFLLAFQYILSLKSNNTLNMLFVDEILDNSGFDLFRKDQTLRYLKELSEEKFILVISHDQNLDEELFDKIIDVTRRSGFSEYNLN